MDGGEEEHARWHRLVRHGRPVGELGDVGPVLLEARLGRSGDGQRHRSAQHAGEQLRRGRPVHRAQIAVSTLDMLEPRQDPDAPVAEIAMFYWTICTGIVQS